MGLSVLLPQRGLQFSERASSEKIGLLKFMKVKEVIYKGFKIVIEYDRKSSLVWLRKKDRSNVSDKRYALPFEIIKEIAKEII